MHAFTPLSSLSVAAFAVLNTLASVAIVFAVGEGDLFQGNTGYYAYCLAVLGLAASFVALILRTIFTPDELPPKTILPVRYLTMIHCASILAMFLGIIACVALGDVASGEVVTTAVAIACWVCFRSGMYVTILSMIMGGLLGIFIDLVSLVSKPNFNSSEAK